MVRYIIIFSLLFVFGRLNAEDHDPDRITRVLQSQLDGVYQRLDLLSGEGVALGGQDALLFAHIHTFSASYIGEDGLNAQVNLLKYALDSDDLELRRLVAIKASQDALLVNRAALNHFMVDKELSEPMRASIIESLRNRLGITE